MSAVCCCCRVSEAGYRLVVRVSVPIGGEAFSSLHYDHLREDASFLRRIQGEEPTRNSRSTARLSVKNCLAGSVMSQYTACMANERDESCERPPECGLGRHGTGNESRQRPQSLGESAEGESGIVYGLHGNVRLLVEAHLVGQFKRVRQSGSWQRLRATRSRLKVSGTKEDRHPLRSEGTTHQGQKNHRSGFSIRYIDITY